MKKLVVLLLSLTLLLALTGCESKLDVIDLGGISKDLSVHFIDVGQGDSILVQLPDGKNMLIDAGPNKSAEALVSYLQNLKINKLDYLIATHPHEDHIGGMDEIVNTFEIGEVYMPAASSTTKTFERLQDALEAKNLFATAAFAGVSVVDEGDLTVTMFSPNSQVYDNLNNYSPVIKLVYGDTSFLFTGDAEAESEAEILKAGYDLQADVLKVGHHGSHSSTSPEFLAAVNPIYAVICCGENNDYGHPHQVTLDKLAGITIYRTDLDGNILFVSDGHNLDVSTSK
ncbi:MAG: MBL fold metallo-hydrolase [Clostridia bacterium]|nr:MBL fold metallo-hydrolase [Clostridia bacterium]